MKKFVLKVALFLGLFFLLMKLVFFVGDWIAEKVYGPNTKCQIETSFKYALESRASNWILGNSRLYRGLNPENDSWYNFAHDNDSYNQMYYKLKYLLEHEKKVDTLIIGVDYFQFGVFSNTRNYVYDNFFGLDYVRDYTPFVFREWIDNIKRIIVTKQNFVPAIIRYCQNLFVNDVGGAKLRKNGSYFNDMGKAKENDFEKRDSTMEKIQVEYFEKILILCKHEHIELFALMMPVRDNELKSYSSQFLKRFNGYITETLETTGFKNRYIDMSNHPDFKDYRKYTDITHLNSRSADEFTHLFFNLIRNKSN